MSERELDNHSLVEGLTYLLDEYGKLREWEESFADDVITAEKVTPYAREIGWTICTHYARVFEGCHASFQPMFPEALKKSGGGR